MISEALIDKYLCIEENWQICILIVSLCFLSVFLGKLDRALREGFKNKIKKKYGIFHTFLTPPLRWGKVWNLFMILFNIQGSNLRCFLMHFTTVGIGKNGV